MFNSDHSFICSICLYFYDLSIYILIHHAKVNQMPLCSPLWTLPLCSCDLVSIPQSHSQPAVSAASPVSRCDADGASGARLQAVPGGQHGLCTHPSAVHGATPGIGEGESLVVKLKLRVGA